PRTPPLASPPPGARRMPPSTPWLLHALGSVRTLFAASLPQQPTPVPPQHTPRQGELSLATVQVKRNDLVDADIEVHPQPTRPTDDTRKPKTRLWHRWTERWSTPRRPALTGLFNR
ncbi:MAG TPA: hypothetical protein PKM73_18745, partial [Verrucomicrobiota bacterium]|nr:hypothetical protein [Verrucomicrobiota bacterium]